MGSDYFGLRMKGKRKKEMNIENVNFEGVCLARVLFSLILLAFWAHRKQFSRPLSMCYRYQRKVCEQNHLVPDTFDGQLEPSYLLLSFQMEKYLPLVISSFNGISYIKRLNMQRLEITFFYNVTLLRCLVQNGIYPLEIHRKCTICGIYNSINTQKSA